MEETKPSTWNPCEHLSPSKLIVSLQMGSSAMSGYVIAAALSYTKGTGLSTILSHRGRSRSCTDTVTELRATQSHHESSITSQGVFIYARTSVSNNRTINWSTMGPTLSVFLRNAGNNMSCDLMNNNKTTMNNHKTALLHSSPL